MLRYVIKRILQLIPTLILVSILVFMMVRFIPGDPITLLRCCMAYRKAVAPARNIWIPCGRCTA